jgi:hypothetical protein
MFTKLVASVSKYFKRTWHKIANYTPSGGKAFIVIPPNASPNLIKDAIARLNELTDKGYFVHLIQM